MNIKFFCLLVSFAIYNFSLATESKIKIQMILGSTRKARMADKLSTIFKQFAQKRSDVLLEVIDLKDYKLTFFNEELPPIMRKEIKSPKIKRWSNKVKEADAFIILSPEYNYSIPGVLKNAFDSIYVEWNNKPVAFITYAGGPTGGESAMSHLKKIGTALKMKQIETEIKIPSVFNAFNEDGNLIDQNIEIEFNKILDQLK